MKASTYWGERLVVAAGHSLAAHEAAKVYRAGGNIVDAAIAGAATLSVVLPYACGLGGDLFALYWEQRSKTCHVLNASGRSPRHSGRAGTPAIPSTGIRSVSVPGMVAGWCDLHRRFGAVPFDQLLSPAIRYARDGFAAHKGLIANTASQASMLERDPNAASIFLPDGKIPDLGATIRQEHLAQTLELVARTGGRAFYCGAIAERIAAYSSRLGGWLNKHDLSEHASLWQRPLSVTYQGHRIFAAPPNAPGGLLLAHLYSVGDAAADTSAFIQRWFQARESLSRLIADPEDAEDVMRKELSALEKADGEGLGLPRLTDGPFGKDTSSLVLMDHDGNAISLVQSVAAPFGAGLVVEGTGIVMNNRMQGFESSGIDDVSLSFGGVRVAGGKRPPHSLCPVIVARGNEALLAITTPGHLGQTCVIAQILERVLRRGQALGAAVEAPRWTIGQDGSLLLEKDFASEEVFDAFSDAGVQQSDANDLRFGSIKAAKREAGGMVAAGDYRRVADVAGW